LFTQKSVSENPPVSTVQSLAALQATFNPFLETGPFPRKEKGLRAWLLETLFLHWQMLLYVS
jgi:hypothetical protein